MGARSRVSLGEWESLSLSPCMASVPATTAALFVSPLDDDRGGWGKRLTRSHRTVCPTCLIIKIFFSGHSLVDLHMGHRYPHFCREKAVPKSLLQISLSPIL